MSFRFITKSIHAYLIDYPVAIVLIVAPFVLKLGQSGLFAMRLSIAAGVVALLLAALTDHKRRRRRTSAPCIFETQGIPGAGLRMFLFLRAA